MPHWVTKHSIDFEKGRAGEGGWEDMGEGMRLIAGA